MDAHVQTALENLIISTQEAFKANGVKEQQQRVLGVTTEFMNRINSWAGITPEIHVQTGPTKTSSQKIKSFHRRKKQYDKHEKQRMIYCAKSVIEDKMQPTVAADLFEFAYAKVKLIINKFEDYQHDMNREVIQDIVVKSYAVNDSCMIETTKKAQVSMMAVSEILFDIRAKDVEDIIMDRINKSMEA